jgi:dTMP kinase
MRKGRLITFEGIEGSGKSTQMALVADWLEGNGLPVWRTREPGGTRVGAEIRKILLSEQTGQLLPHSEALLYLADRFQHIREVITPRLAAGDMVLCDRYHDSTIAYQGFARGLPLEWLEGVWNHSGLAREPDLTLIFDIDPDTGIRRSLEKLKRQKLDEARFEKEALVFHSRVREGFKTLARRHPGRIRLIDACRPIEIVHQEARMILEGHLFTDPD